MKKLENLKPLSEQIVSGGDKKPAKKSNETKVKDNTVYFKTLDEGVTLPTYAHKGDAAMDLIATSVTYDDEHDAYIYGTGLYCESKEGMCALILPRSSNMKTDAYLPNSVGLIDTYTYRGEIKVVYKLRKDLCNEIYEDAMHTYLSLPWWKKIFTTYNDVVENCFAEYEKYIEQYMPYEVGDKLAQLMFINTCNVKIKQKDELSKTERGEGGFGSTGK